MQPVRFSVIAGPRQRPDREQTAAEAWKLYIDDIIRADQLGFDSAFIGEHHFCFAQGNSSPFVFLAEAAARTEHIRIGTSVICMPFHNPLRVAEDIAAVDIVSNGRFDFGVGVGSQYEEFETFGIDSAERYGRTWEAIDLIDRCLHSGEEEFSHKGKYFTFPNVRWIIPPVQERVPIWWGGFGPQGVRRAAEHGYNLIATDVTGAYAQTLSERGQRAEDHYVGFTTMVSVARTREEAFDAIGDPCAFVNNVYATRRQLDGTWPGDEGKTSIEALRTGNENQKEDVAMFSPVADTVDGVIERLLPMVRGERGFLNHIGVELRPPGTDTAHVEKSMNLFAKEVIPVLREEFDKHYASVAAAS
jgi:alkanesulfonate monooxygenase SsuD/methylene tetrahydromethanopterin reductase-like flavin-dependent oxidoreductase (luciferase family)